MSLSKRTRFEVFKRDSFTCQYCGAKAPDAVLHVDHIIAIANGGKNGMANLATACVACNQGKAAVPLGSVVPRANIVAPPPALLPRPAVVAADPEKLVELKARQEQVEMMIAWHRSLLGWSARPKRGGNHTD